MLSTKLMLLSATLFSHALAQAKIAFTSVPAIVVAGQVYNITWGGGDGSPVTITLREGDSNDLKTIDTLADGVEEDFFAWNVSKSLSTASDYALQITQGQGSINYSGQFSIAGGTGTSTISFSGASTATTASNATVPLTATSTVSAGRTTLVASNTTFSSATLSRTSSTSLIPAVTQHMTTSSAASSANFGDQPSSTSASQTAAATTSAPDSGGATQLGSSAALVMGVFAAIMLS